MSNRARFWTAFALGALIPLLILILLLWRVRDLLSHLANSF